MLFEKEKFLWVYLALSTTVNVFLFSTYYEPPETVGRYLSQQTDHDQLLRTAAAVAPENVHTREPPSDDATLEHTQPAELPLIYAITPTYRRYTQLADLTRFSQTLRLVPRLHWLVVEDSTYQSQRVRNVLERSGLPYEHLLASTVAGKHPRSPKGVAQRNRALKWIRDNVRMNDTSRSRGVVYFADDDNAYDIRLFERMRYISRVGVWPVAFCGGLGLEKPRVNEVTRKVEGWDVYWGKNRTFATDMAGFAVNVQLILSTSVEFEFRTALESVFMDKLNITLADLEPVTRDLREVLVWHVNTVVPNVVYEREWKRTHHGKWSYYGWYI